MKIHLSTLSAASLVLFAACGASDEGTVKVTTTPTPQPAANQPAADQPAAAQPSATLPVAGQPASGATGGALTADQMALKPGPRSPAEVAGPFAIPEDARHMAAPYPAGLTAETPLIVRGETIPPDEIRRTLIAGLGFAFSDYAKFEVILGQELDSRQKQGEDISVYTVTDADLEKHIAAQRVDFATRYPTLDFKTEVGRAYLDYDIYLEPARQSLLFDSLFLQENPADWPALTIEVIRGFGGEPFVTDAFDSYARRKQQMIDQGLDSIPPDDPIIVSTWRDTVLRALSDFAVVETDPKLLPPGVLMTVDGHEVQIDTVWKIIKPHVSEFEMAKARRVLVMIRLLEMDLESRGELISQEEFIKHWVPEGRTYRQTLELNMSRANSLLGMPSMEAYARYERVQESLLRAMPDEAAAIPQNREFVSAINQITGAAKCEAEFILSSAWDGDTASWKENGWEQARQASIAVRTDLDAGADWRQVRELHSQFWDPPLPEIGHKPQFGFRFKGAFGQQTRNQLVGLLEESEGYNFLFGLTLADQVFFQQKVGTIAGPLMGPKGYYIVRLMSRTPATMPLDMGKDSHRELVVRYFLRDVLTKRAQALAAAATAEGALSGI